MTHTEIRAHLSEYLERDLDPAERSRVDGHLEGCASCSRELHELRETVSLLRRLPEPGQPPALADAVMARIASQTRAPGRLRLLLRRVEEPRIALALAAGLSGLFLMIQPDHRVAAPPPAAAVVAWDTSLQPPWTRLDEGVPGPTPGAAVISGATPSDIYAAYARRARETALRLRSAGHPNSESLAAHFETRPTVALADWQPR